MKKVIFGNADYQRHMTDEGRQLQEGLALQGWMLAGRRLFFDSVDTVAILERFDPDLVFVQDVRDWDRVSSGCFDKSVSFERIEELRSHRSEKLTVVKDAGSLVRYQERFAHRIGASRVLHYYHRESVLPLSRWLEGFDLVRIYHTIDGEFCDRIRIDGPRRRAIVTGAISSVYPLRARIFENARALGVDRMRHPGYGNFGCTTPKYLQALAGYKVHLATASSYGFALRKIIESVAMGATPVTNLPAYDVLPGINDAIIRVSTDISVENLRKVIDLAVESWDPDRAHYYAGVARDLYDYRVRGRMLDQALAGEEVAA